MMEKKPITWITKNGKHIPIYDEPSEDEKKKDREIGQNEKEATKKNGINVSKEDASHFGEPGSYRAYRSGDIFNSPMGYLSFGLEESQSYLYAEDSGKPIEGYDIQIRKPYVLNGNDFDKMQDVIAKKFAGESYLSKSNIEEMRQVQKRAAEEMQKQGYDAILMDKKNNITGKHQYEINLLNKYKSQAVKRRKV